MPDDATIQPETPIAEVLPPEPRSPLFRKPKGLPKTGGRQKGTPNKGPRVAQVLANKASPDAVRHLIKVMQFQRFAINDTRAWPTIHSATQAAMKILDIADMPAKEAALGAVGTPVQININLGSAPQAVTIDGEAVRVEAAE